MSQLLKCDHCGALTPGSGTQAEKDGWYNITAAKVQAMPTSRTLHLCGPCFKETFPS